MADSPQLLLLTGNGDGTFQPPTPMVYAGITPWVVTAGEFNGDGRTDLAMVDFSTAYMSVLLGTAVITPQTITFGPLSNTLFSSGTVTLTATASSVSR